jgi:hypothetical protein
MRAALPSYVVILSWPSADGAATARIALAMAASGIRKAGT